MTRKTTLRRIAVLLTVLLVATAVGPTGAAAAPTIVTGTTEIDDGTTIDTFNASPDVSHTFTVNNSGETADPGIKITLNGSDTVFHRNESGHNISGNDQWNFTFTEADLADVPMDAGENVTMDLVYYNQSNESGDHSTIQFYLNSTTERAVIYVGDDQLDEDVETATEASTTTEEAFFGLGSERTSSTIEHEDLGVDGSDTTVYVVFANSTVQDSFASALDRKLWGSYDSGDYVKYQQLWLNGAPQLVFNEEAPEAITDNEDFTHGVYTEVDGQDAIEITLGEDDFEGEDEVDLLAHGNDAYGIWTNAENQWANLRA